MQARPPALSQDVERRRPLAAQANFKSMRLGGGRAFQPSQLAPAEPVVGTDDLRWSHDTRSLSRGCAGNAELGYRDTGPESATAQVRASREMRAKAAA